MLGGPQSRSGRFGEEKILLVTIHKFKVIIKRKMKIYHWNLLTTKIIYPLDKLHNTNL
jgi:hypothetical protein